MNKIIFSSLFALSLLFFGYLAQAQETAAKTLSEITAEEMGVVEPTVLPGDGLGYFLKNLGQVIKEAITFDPEKKTGLQLKHTAEKLAEIQVALEQKKD